MTDTDIEAVYKGTVDVSHVAALRAVFDAGYAEGAGQTIGVGGVDQADSGTPLTQIQITDLEVDVAQTS